MRTRMNELARPKCATRHRPIRRTDRACFNTQRLFEVLMRIWRRHKAGYVSSAARHPATGQWIERCFNIRTERRKIRQFLANHPAQEWDLCYCPNVFSEPYRRADVALPTPYAWCDIDAADPDGFKPLPTMLVSTSPGRYQGLWSLDRAVSPRRAEVLSKGLAYRYGGDRNGWSVTKFLRIPGTINHKPEYDAPRVRIVRDSDERLPVWRECDHHVSAPATLQVDPQRHDPAAVVRRYRPKLSGNMYRLMTDTWTLSPDRSRCVFMIVAALYEAGAEPDEIAAVVWRSPYFLEKYGQSRSRLNAELGRILGKLGGGQ